MKEAEKERDLQGRAERVMVAKAMVVVVALELAMSELWC
jgi:hypothetical protein